MLERNHFAGLEKRRVNTSESERQVAAVTVNAGRSGRDFAP